MELLVLGINREVKLARGMGLKLGLIVVMDVIIEPVSVF